MPTNIDFVYLFPSQMAPGADGQLSLQWPAGVAPFGSEIALALNDAAASLHLQRNAFTDEECRRIVGMGDARAQASAGTEDRENFYRVSKIAWIEPEADSFWLFHRIGMLFLQANRHFGFDITGLIDALQFTVYGPAERFDWHIDSGPGPTSARKLSMTMQLSPASAYDGGALEFLNAPNPNEAREIGAATFFPSYLAHRVSPVTRGMRISLVAWACGPAFR